MHNERSLGAALLYSMNLGLRMEKHGSGMCINWHIFNTENSHALS